MEELREMTRQEVDELDGKMVVEIYNDFDEKLNGAKREPYKVPFVIITTACGKWYTDGEFYIHKKEYHTNTFLDFICKGYTESEAHEMATNDVVTVTKIYKKA